MHTRELISQFFDESIILIFSHCAILKWNFTFCRPPYNEKATQPNVASEAVLRPLKQMLFGTLTHVTQTLVIVYSLLK